MTYDYTEAKQYYSEISALCKPDCYNLVLHKHLGDVFYALAAKQDFETFYQKKLHFIIRPQHAFLMKLFNIKEYTIYDLDKIVKKNDALKNILGINKNDTVRISRLEDEFFQALFTCLPIIGIPFICDNLINNFFEYNRYWCHRWCKNMGIDDAKKFLIPSGKIILSGNAKRILKQIAPVSKIVLVAPEAATATEFGPELWNVIAEEVHKKGYTIIVNSKKYKINHGISAFDLGLSLEDIVALGLSCAYVFSLRSGLCDVLVGAREKLYAFYPAQLRREMRSLSKPFTEKTNVNEILIYQWKISPVIWEEIDLTQKLQKQINFIHKAYYKEKIKCFVDHKKKYSKKYHLFNDLYGVSHTFPENNIDNPKPKGKTIKLCGITVFRKDYTYQQQKLLKKTYSWFGGLLYWVKKADKSFRIHLFGLCVFNKKYGYYKKISLLGFPIYKRSLRGRYLKKISKCIPSDVDDVYIIRHNFGETYVYLSYFADWVKQNQSQNPAIICWRERDWVFYKMFLPSNIKIIRMDLGQDVLNFFLREDFTYKGHRFFCPTFEIAENMLIKYKKDKKTNFYRYILESMQLKASKAHKNMPALSNSAKENTENFLQRNNITNPFVIVCPNVTSIYPLGKSFWDNLIKELQTKKYTVVVNTFDDECSYTNCIKMMQPIDELFVLAQQAKGIISMGSGLAVFLTAANVKMDLIYTQFIDPNKKYSAKMVQKIYSVYHLPDISDKKIREYNIDDWSEKQITEKILSRY